MRTNAAGIALIKKWEGCRRTAYRDAVGIWTIGYGHTAAAGPPEIRRGMRIPLFMAEEILIRDLATFELAVLRKLDRVPNDNQFAAMVSLCVDPDTLILTNDFRWLRAGDCSASMGIWGVDEENAIGTANKGRKLRIGHIESIQRRMLPRVRVITDKGAIIVSSDHRFLTASTWLPTFRWVRADQMDASLTKKDGRRDGFRHGHYVIPWMPTWHSCDDCFNTGYLAGFLDGEGYLSVIGTPTNRSIVIGFSQNDGIVADRVLRLLKERGFNIAKSTPRKVGQYTITGGLPELFRLLGTIRPRRLISHSAQKWDGVRGFYALPRAHVERVEPVGEGEVISIQTSLGTYFSNGFISHNCYNIGPGNFAKSTVCKAFNAGNLVLAANAFARWNKAGGRVLPGLKSRREAEQALFLTSTGE